MSLSFRIVICLFTVLAAFGSVLAQNETKAVLNANMTPNPNDPASDK